jgi:hypothetical protein
MLPPNPPGRFVSGAAVVAAALLLAGCAGASGSAAGAAGATNAPSAGPSGSAAPSAPATTPTAAPSDLPPASPAPSTTAGLSQRSLPVPSDLGNGWTYRIDPGGPEAGYEGNGQPAQARDPAEVAAGIAPLGCLPPATAPPLARAALEVDYGRSKPAADGVGLLLEFATHAQAQQFFASYTGVLRTCAAHPPPGAPSITLLPQASSSLFGSIRKDPDSDPTYPVWTEAVRLSGRNVRLLTISTADPAVGTPFRAP